MGLAFFQICHQKIQFSRIESEYTPEGIGYEIFNVGIPGVPNTRAVLSSTYRYCFASEPEINTS